MPTAHYLNLHLNLTQLPIQIRMGACLPQACTEADLRSMVKSTSAWLSAQIQKLGSSMDIELIQRINLGVDMNVYSPVLWEESQSNDKKILSYVVIVIIGLILMLVFSSTIYVMMRRCMSS